jgi:hypothetical protein
LQVSPVEQLLPSSQAVPGASPTCWQTLVGPAVQESEVHGFPSLQSIGSYRQVPVSQESIVQASKSSQVGQATSGAGPPAREMVAETPARTMTDARKIAKHGPFGLLMEFPSREGCNRLLELLRAGPV